MYLDKRKKNGLVLSYDGFKTGKEISDFCFEKLKKTKTYNVLVKKFCKNSLENYFRLYFYLNSFPHAHKIILTKKINIKYCKINFYLEQFLNKKKIEFSKKILLKEEFKKFISLVKIFRKYFLNFKARYFSNKVINNNVKIGISFKEGIDLDKRSDLFWYDEKEFNSEDILIYFEGNSYKYRFEGKEELYKKLNDLKINSLNISDIFFDKKNNNFTDVVNKIENIGINDEEIFAKRISLDLIKKIDFWYSFFNKFKIKVHYDAEEMRLEKLEKNLALQALNAFSIGRVRSYITKGIYDFMGSLSADIIFVNQKDSASRFINFSNNFAKYILITGETNNIFTKKNKAEVEKIKCRIEQNKKKFAILILDSNYSSNRTSSREQFVTKEYYDEFYNKLITLAENHNDIFLIVKTKKNEILQENKKIYEKLIKLERSNSCYIVDNPFRKHPYLYASISNFIVSTGSALPSALIECVSKGKKGIFCDYPNLESLEEEIFKFKKNLIISNLDHLDEKILEFKKNPDTSKIGDWSIIDGMIDYTKDNEGQKKTTALLFSLLKEFKKNKNEKIDIKNVIKNFEKNIGKENIIDLN